MNIFDYQSMMMELFKSFQFILIPYYRSAYTLS